MAKNMKRLSLILAGLLLLLCLMPVLPAQAQPDQSDLLQGRWARSVAVFGGKAYALTQDEDGQNMVLEIIPGQEPQGFATLRAEDAITHLLAGEETLYGFDQESGRIGILLANGIAWQEQAIDTALFTKHPNYPGTPFLFEGRLYTPLADMTDGQDFAPLTLAVSDLQSGESALVPVPAAFAFLPYKAGQLLLLQVEERQGLHDWKLAAFTLDSGKTTPLPMGMQEAFPHSSSIGALAYDKETDRILYSDASQVMASTALAPFERVAVLQLGHISPDYGAGYLLGGAYLVHSGGLFLLKVDQALDITSLTVRGYVPEKVAGLFQQGHPDALLIKQQQTISPEEIMMRFQGGDDAVDIYILMVNSGFRALIDKGYALDLSGDEWLMADHASFYPALQAAMSSASGQLYAVPANLFNRSSSISISHWQEVFGEQPYPTTWGELMDLRLAFARLEHEDLIFFSMGDSPQVPKHLLRQYILQYEQTGEALNFDHPALRHALGAYQNAISLRLDVEEEDWLSETGPTNHLMALFGSGRQFTLPDPLTNSHDLPPLAFEAGQQPKDLVTVYAAIINPLSKNTELAMGFLKTLSQKEADPARFYAIHPEENEPYPYPDAEYAQQIEFRQMQQKDFEAQIAQAEAGDEARVDLGFLRARLAQIQEDLADQERLRWMLSAEEIAAYREKAQYMATADRSLLLGEQAWEQISGHVDRLYERALSLDDFLTEMNRLSLMVYQENR